MKAMKMLEDRIQQLELPAHGPSASNVSFGDAKIVSELPLALNGSKSSPGDMSMSPANVSALLAKGQVLLDMDRSEEAVACFQDVLAIDPANPEAHLKKGVALERMNKLDQSSSTSPSKPTTKRCGPIPTAPPS
jgi:tetratricopeptide (TPR) repeat protein